MKKVITICLCLVCSFITASAQKYYATGKQYGSSYLEGYCHLGVLFAEKGAGPTYDGTIGARIQEHLFIGGHYGFHTHFVSVPEELRKYYGNKKVSSTLYIPIGGSIKFYLAKKSQHDLIPYIEGSFGTSIPLSDNLGFMFWCQAGAAVDFKRFSLGIGYNGLVKGITGNYGYVRIGVRLGM